MARRTSAEVIIARLERHAKQFQGDSRMIAAAFTEIGLLMTNETKLNLRRQGMVDTGFLMNSIGHVFEKTRDGATLKVGSFGVPYAAIHEFGMNVTERMRRGMFATLRATGKLGKRPSKGVLVGNKFLARPYLIPAFNKHQKRAIKILREAVRLEMSRR